MCCYCNAEEDSSEHTLQACLFWNQEREELERVIGRNLQLLIVVQKILESKDAWDAFSKFTESVMLRKETDESERQQRQRRLDRSISPD